MGTAFNVSVRAPHPESSIHGSGCHTLLAALRAGLEGERRWAGRPRGSAKGLQAKNNEFSMIAHEARQIYYVFTIAIPTPSRF